VKQTSLADMRCSAARALQEVGPWWSLLLVRCCFQGLTRFKDFQVALGIGKNTLSLRLKELVEEGILERQPDSQGSKYHEYLLTQKGLELAPVIVSLAHWGDKWLPHEQGPSIVLRDRRTQDPLRLGLVDPSGQEIAQEFVQSSPGEGVLESLLRGGR
jgi:DNA-binding HxlR family transcriptional regulator